MGRGAAWLLATLLTASLPFAISGLSEARNAIAAIAPGRTDADSAALLKENRPRRIVSLNPCLDAILLEVADDAQITALSHFSRDPEQSAVAQAARRFPVTYETAEEILLLKPDLVLASIHTAPATRRALERMNIPVALFGVPATVEESHAQVRDVAARVGHPERGEALVRRIEAALEALRPQASDAGPPVPALILQPGGFSPGAGTLQDDLLARAGLRNVSARYGVNFWGVVRLEELVENPPRLLLTGADGADASAGGDRLLSHPVLKRLEGRMLASPYPRQLLYCGGPTLLEAARYLRLARTALENAS
ncbi:MAG TPA: ABC transporter substrate-binding protein [Pedomonas sp.]|uniref:ABC transporter substrate-binding protein n=1 Tax=Pedomonas sp. TaxID=2976421 RepID=UPI002F4237A5